MANIKIGLTRESGIIDVYNKQWINSIESTSQSTTDPATIEYGVLANSGSINLRDLDGKIRNDLESGDLPISNVETTISINDTQIQAHLTNDSNYTESDKTLSLSLTNKLSLFDSMSYNGFPLSETPMTAYELLSDIFSKLGVDMANDVTFTTDALNALIAITIPYPYIKPCSGREALNKICEIAQLSMFQSGNGKIRVISTTQKNSTSSVYPYNVPSHYKITELNKAIVLKNKYDAIDMKATKVVDEIDFGTLYQTISVPTAGYETNSNNQNVQKTQDSPVIGGMYYEHYGKIYIRSYYINVNITIPKKKNENKTIALSLLSGQNAKNEPNIQYSVSYRKNSGIASMPSNIASSSINDITFTQTNGINENGDIPTTYTFEYLDSTGETSEQVSISQSFANLSNNGRVNAFTQDDNNYYVSLLLLVGGKYVGLKGTRYVQDGSTISENGEYEELIPLKVEVSFYGNVREISFEDVDASTSNISTAKNPVSLRHNELMQLGATWGDTSLVDKIKNNVLTDYENGIPTATIDLFCGSLSNGELSQAIDWASGEILSVGDKIKFADDKEELVWDITGRTFTYNASPKIRLELKKLSVWNSVWSGQLLVNFPKRAGTIKSADGYYYGSETTYISLSDYLKNPNSPIRISGSGLYRSTGLGEGTAYTIENLELSNFSTIVKDNDTEGELFGYITAKYNAETQQIEFTATGRSTTSGGLLTTTITFNLTKIEQYY